MSFLSSSEVHGPFFNPTLSQHGCLPISHKQLIEDRESKLATTDSFSSKDTQITRQNVCGNYLLIYRTTQPPNRLWQHGFFLDVGFFNLI